MNETLSPRPQVCKRKALSLENYVQGVLAGDRGILARAITLVESQKSANHELVQEVLQQLLPNTEQAHRIGISGVPGVGKSTFIERFGLNLVNKGHRVAVLTVDPSSSVSGGSILGDKSRMGRLAQHPDAYIRPSPSGLSLGGVARRTRETMLLCEAAGFDVVIIETVGVGQSEVAVSDMVDFFLVLMLPGAGDELQGIKKGILELADLVAINKADGDNLPRARSARREYAAALRYISPRSSAWKPQVLTVSALTGDGLNEVWDLAREHRKQLVDSGEMDRRRREQKLSWMWSQVEENLLLAFGRHPEVAKRLAPCIEAVREGTRTPAQAAGELLAAFGVREEDFR